MTDKPWSNGPWYAWVGSGGANFDLRSSDDEWLIGGCGCCGSPFMYGPFKANAYLIAAAPDLVEALIDSSASLVAAVSLLERRGKKAAPSDKMFYQMIEDYKKSIERGRTAIAKARGDEYCGNCGYDIPKQECPICNGSV